MRRRKRNILYLATGIISLISIVILFTTTAPTANINLLLPLPATWTFLVLLLLAGYSFPVFFLKKKKHGVFFSLFLLGFFLFRLLKLTHPLFLILLIGILLTLELFFSSKKA